MHLGALTTKRFVIAAAATALTFFVLGLLATPGQRRHRRRRLGWRNDLLHRAKVGMKYERIWDRMPGKDKRWAKTTSECESGGNPDAIGCGGLYRGAFQFTRSTWEASPKSPGGDPIAYPYRTQAVVAVLLMHRDGAQHWPVCG